MLESTSSFKKSKRRTSSKKDAWRSAAVLDSLEKKLKSSAGKRRKVVVKKTPERSDAGPITHVEWRLTKLESVLKAELGAPALATVRAQEEAVEPEPIAQMTGPTMAAETYALRGLYGLTTVEAVSRQAEAGVAYSAPADRLSSEVMRRQNLEGRIVQLEYIIKSMLEKNEIGAIDVVTDEIDASPPLPVSVQVQQPVAGDFTPQKVRSGTPRLDDLLLGGIPFGSNVLVFGPPFAGKEVLVNSFIAEGVKWGTPVIWLLTDRSPRDIRNEMKAFFPDYEDAEKLGIIRYIDAYSRAAGNNAVEPRTDYVDSPTDFDAIQRLVERAANEFKKEHDYYRMAVRGLSTLIAYSDSRAVFKFLNSFVGKRKRDSAVAFYTIAKGVHAEHDIQMISSLMDGVIELKFENQDTFMAIKGVCDVRSRSFVRYALSKTGIEIGSFSLDHIR